MSLPSKIIFPPARGKRPEIALSVVVLPAPLAPISATSWPRSTVSEMPLTAVTWPYRQTTSQSSSTLLPLPKISTDHFGIVLNLRRRSLGYNAAVVEHNNTIAHLHDHRHIVLDE